MSTDKKEMKREIKQGKCRHLFALSRILEKLNKRSWALDRTHHEKPTGFVGYNFTLYEEDGVTIQDDLFAKTASGMIRKIKKLFILD